jgi:tyrosine aminotransferase
MTILKTDDISEQQQTTTKMGNVNNKMTTDYTTQKQNQSEIKVPKLEEYNVRVGPLAARPKNRIRLFVEDMLANATNTTCSEGRPLPTRKNLSLGDPTALGLAPPQQALDAVVQAATAGLLTTKEAHGYQHSCGSPAFRQSITDFIRPGIASDDVFVTSGCSQALQFSLATLCTEGQNVLIPCPCFPLYQTLCEFVGVEAKPYTLDASKDWEADMQELERQCDENTACLLICNPGNPTSHSYTPDHLEQLLRFAYKKRIPVVADEVYAFMTFDINKEEKEEKEAEGFHWMAEVALTRLGRERPPILSCSALSKRFLVPGWRCGWLALFDDANDTLRKASVHNGVAALCQIGMTTNSLIQAAAPAVLQQTPETYHKDLTETIRRGAKYCVDRCSKCPGLKCLAEPKGAMYFMPQVDQAGFSDLRELEENEVNKARNDPMDVVFCRCLLQEKNVFMLPGTLFGAESFVRIVAAAPIQELKEAWDRIESMCIQYYKGK